MRGIKEAEVKEILRQMEEARDYIRLSLLGTIEASSRRLMRVENALRLSLGEKPRWTDAEISNPLGLKTPEVM